MLFMAHLLKEEEEERNHKSGFDLGILKIENEKSVTFHCILQILLLLSIPFNYNTKSIWHGIFTLGLFAPEN